VASTPAAKEPATTDPEGSRTGSLLSEAWDGEPFVVDGLVEAGVVEVEAGTVVVEVAVVGFVVAGGMGADVGGVGGGAGGAAVGVAAGVGMRRVHPGSIQWGSVRVSPPGWGRPSLSW
jgi:hypothetical protein